MNIGVFAMKGISVTLFLLCLLGVAVIQATPIPCPGVATPTTYAVLIGLSGPGNGCIHQDKLFNNFTYTGADDPSLIRAHHIFNAGIGGQDIHGWSFSNANAANEWTSGFTMSYSIQIIPGFPNQFINISKDQIDSGRTGPANGTNLDDTQSSPVGLLHMDGLSTADETVQNSYANTKGPITTTSVAKIPSGSILITYDQEWFEVTASGVPEPGTYALLGGALLLFGTLRRRRKSS